MTRSKKTFEKILNGTKSIRFEDFTTLAEAFGFELIRIAGSHHIYTHTSVTRPLNIQKRKNEAKPYQIKQFMDMIEEFGLKMKD
jgi:predicted RNA binding protein YcfA (HicA-like mRNA interferase family)